MMMPIISADLMSSIRRFEALPLSVLPGCSSTSVARKLVGERPESSSPASRINARAFG